MSRSIEKCLTMLFAGALITGLVSGCATVPKMETSSPHLVSSSESLVVLPPGTGAVLSVVETGYVNAIEQEINFETFSKTPGQNTIKVQRFYTKATSSTAGGLQDVPLGDIDMAGEARGTVSYADMKLSPYFVKNSYGPFGYSMGRTETGDVCMYAWQRIAPNLTPAGGVENGALNLRMQVCDSKRTEQQLLQIMAGLRIQGVTGKPRKFSLYLDSAGTPLGMADFIAVGNVLPDLPVATPRVANTPKTPEPDGPVPAPTQLVSSVPVIPAPETASSALAIPLIPPPP